jgi:serine/threonine protein kinase
MLTDVGMATFIRTLIEDVGYLHAAGIYHRDVKASNFLLTRGLEIVWMDYGFAIAVDAILILEELGLCRFGRLIRVRGGTFWEGAAGLVRHGIEASSGLNKGRAGWGMQCWQSKELVRPCTWIASCRLLVLPAHVCSPQAAKHLHTEHHPASTPWAKSKSHLTPHCWLVCLSFT